MMKETTRIALEKNIARLGDTLIKYHHKKEIEGISWQTFKKYVILEEVVETSKEDVTDEFDEDEYNEFVDVCCYQGNLHEVYWGDHDDYCYYYEFDEDDRVWKIWKSFGYKIVGKRY